MEGNNKDLKVAIIGGGNVGSTISVILSSLNCNIHLVDSSKKTYSKDKQINIIGDFGSKMSCVTLIDSVDQLDTDYDIIFVCTKLFDAIEYLKSIRKRIKPKGTIVTIQNIFWVDRAFLYLPSKNSVFAYLDFNCAKKDEYTIVKNYDGIKLGIVNKDAYDNLKLITSLFEKICKVDEINDFIGFVLGRNIINIAISLIGAVSGLKLGDCLSNKVGKELFVNIIKEGMCLFDSLNINVMPYADRLNYYLFIQDSNKGKFYRRRMIKLLRKNNYNVCSSLLFDLEQNEKSEILTVVKTFIRHAQIKNIKIPTIITLYKFINEIKKRERNIDINIFKDKTIKNLVRR